MNQHFITEIHIEHVRHLKEIDIPLSRESCKHLILTGKNGSGKTSVIEALAAYLSQFTVGVDERQAIDSDLSQILYLRKNLKNTVDDNLERKKILHNLEIAENHVKKYSQGVTASFVDADSVSNEFLDGRFVIVYYKAEREYIAKNEEHIEKIDLKDKYSMQDRPGKDFVKYLLDLKATGAMAKAEGNPQRAEQIDTWFSNFDDILKQIFNVSDIHLDFNYETYQFHIIEKGKEPFSFDTLSSGYAAIFDIVADLMMRMEKKARKQYDVDGIVLIDEIETHLHLELQKKILPILTKLFPNIQFIVTTHSPFVLNSIANTVIYDLENHTLVQSERTAELIDEVFNLKNTGMRTIKTQRRMKALQQEMNIFFNEIEKYNRKKIKWFEKRVTVRLKRSSPFAAFKRSYIRNHSVEYAALQEYVAL
jgi:predicted ATP-binding protein involved in virulence